jgi:hypothetical protein
MMKASDTIMLMKEDSKIRLSLRAEDSIIRTYASKEYKHVIKISLQRRMRTSAKFSNHITTPCTKEKT